MKRKNNKKGSEGVSWTIVVLVIALFLLFVIGYSIYRYVKAPLYGAGEEALSDLKSLKSINALQSQQYADLTQDQRDDLVNDITKQKGCGELTTGIKNYDKPQPADSKLNPKAEQLKLLRTQVQCYTSNTGNPQRCSDAAAVLDSADNKKFFTDEYLKIDRDQSIGVVDSYVYVGQCFEQTEDPQKAITYYQRFVELAPNAYSKEFTVDAIKKRITDLQNLKSEDRKLIGDKFTALSKTVAQALGSNDEKKLYAATTDTLTFVQDSEFANIDPSVTSDYFATAYYYRGLLAAQLAKIQIQGSGQCDTQRDALEPLFTTQYQSSKLKQHSTMSSVMPLVTQSAPGQANYDLAQCYTNLRLPDDARDYYLAMFATQDQKLIDAATKLLPTNCGAITYINECNNINKEYFPATSESPIPKEVYAKTRCYWYPESLTAMVTESGTCYSCSKIIEQGCAAYGRHSDTCNANPCGFVPPCEDSAIPFDFECKAQ